MTQPNRFPMPIPFGWFFVHFSHELHTGDVKTLHLPVGGHRHRH